MVRWSFITLRGHLCLKVDEDDSHFVTEVSISKNDEASVTIHLNDTNYDRIRCSVKSFKSSPENSTFDELQGFRDGKRFCSKLASIMEEHNIVFSDPEESSDASSDCSNDSGLGKGKKNVLCSPAASPDPKRPKYVHNLTFLEEFEILRHIHPQKDSAGPDEMLNSADRVWRKDAAFQLHFEGGMKDFGGHFKEQIAVATLSNRCYDKVLSICTKYAQRQLKNQSNTKVNRTLFKEVTGIRDEEKLFYLLTQFEEGSISKEEFNRRAKMYKDDAPDRPRQISKNQTKKDELLEAKNRIMHLEQENRHLREEGEKQKEVIFNLQKEVQNLRESQENEDSSNDDSEDAFAFHEDPPFNPAEQIPVARERSGNTIAEDILKDTEEAFLATMDTIEKTEQQIAQPKQWLPACGDIVEAKDNDLEWYKAKVLDVKLDDGEALIHYIGFSAAYDAWKKPEDIRPSTLKPGDKVKALWDDRRYYKAVILKKTKTGYRVRYVSDGIQKNVKDSEIIL